MQPKNIDNIEAEIISHEELLATWLSIAESQICALEVLSEQNPIVNNLLETEMSKLSDEFFNLTKSLEEQKAILNKVQDGKSKNVSDDLSKINHLYSDVERSLQNITVSMQFQDRVSQNLVININVMTEVINYLEVNIDKTLDNYEHEFEKTHKRRRVNIDKLLTKKIIEKLWLGDLKNKYVNHLIDHKYIKDASEIDYVSTAASDEDVELF